MKGKWSCGYQKAQQTFNLEKVPNLLKDALRNVGVI